MLSMTLALLLAAPQSTPKIPQVDHISQGFLDDAPAGTALAAAGDWNLDGAADYLVGIPDFDDATFFGSLPDMGRVEVRSGIDGSLLESLTDDSLVDGSGVSLEPRMGAAVAGDFKTGQFNSNSFAVGLPGVEEVRVYRSSPFGGLSLAATLSGDTTTIADDIGFGSVVENVGDLNGDGLPELAVGSPEANGLFGGIPVTLARGRVRLFDGDTFTEIGDWSFAGSGSRLGTAICSIADVTGDGRRDLAISAPGDGAGGRVYLIDPTFSGFLSIITWFGATTDDERFGSDVTSLGDLNGDGFDELLVGAGGYSVGLPPFTLPRGRVAVIDGNSLTEVWSRTGLGFGHLGESVAAADLDGDGRLSAIVNDSSGLNESATQVRALDGLTGDEELAWDTWPADRDTDLAGIGDTNGDGGDEVVIGLPELDFGQGGQMVAREFLGTPGGGGNTTWTVGPNIAQDFDSVAVAALIAEEGDTLDVFPGTYDTAVLTRSIHVMGSKNPTTGKLQSSVASIAVVNVAHVRLTKLNLSGLELQQIPGRATIDKVDVNDVAPVRISDCADVVVARSRFTVKPNEGLAVDAPNALEINASEVQLHKCTLTGGDGVEFGADGGDGVRISGGSRVWSFDSSALGGDGNGGDAEFFLDGGNGGDGFDLRDGSFLDVRGRQVVETEGGVGGWSFAGTVGNGTGIRTEAGCDVSLSNNLDLTIDSQGPGVLLTSSSTPSFFHQPTWEIGASSSPTFLSPAGTIQVLLFSAGAAKLELPNVATTPVWIDLAQLNVPLAPAVGTGSGPETETNYAFPVPNLSTLLGYEFHLQELLFDPLTGLFTGSGGGAVRLDS